MSSRGTIQTKLIGNKRDAVEAKIKGGSPDSKLQKKLDLAPEEVIRVLREELEGANFKLGKVKEMLMKMKNHKDMEEILLFLEIKQEKEIKIEVIEKPKLSRIKMSEHDKKLYVNETLIVSNFEMKDVKLEVMEEKLIKAGMTQKARLTPVENERKLRIHFDYNVDAYKCYKNVKLWALKKWEVEYFQGVKITFNKFDKEWANGATAKFAGVPRAALPTFFRDVNRSTADMRTSKLDDGKSKFLDIWVKFSSADLAIEMILSRDWESGGIKTRLFNEDDGRRPRRRKRTYKSTRKGGPSLSYRRRNWRELNPN